VRFSFAVNKPEKSRKSSAPAPLRATGSPWAKRSLVSIEGCGDRNVAWVKHCVAYYRHGGSMTDVRALLLSRRAMCRSDVLSGFGSHVVRRIGMGKFGAEIEKLCRIIDPHDEHDQRSRRAVG
jgi:hypothetical protein